MSNSIKKIVSAIIASACLFSCGGALAYVPNVDDVPYDDSFFGLEEKETLESKGLETVYTLLKFIGAEDRKVSEIVPGETATKALGAKYFAAIKGTNNTAGELPFEDVTDKTQYYEYIKKAYGAGIIEKDKRFNPTAALTMDEAAKMAMRTLEYDKLYPIDEAMSFAYENKLFYGIDTGKNTMSIGELMIFAENVLAVPCIEYSSVSSQGYDIKIGEKSYLEKYKNISVQSGIVTGTEFSSLYGDSDLGKNQIEINRGVFSYESESNADLTGHSIMAYVDNDNDNALICLWKYKSAEEKFKFSEFGEDKGTYITNRDNKRYKIANGARVLYNGIYYGTNDKARSDGLYNNFDNLQLIDNNRDGSYEVIKINRGDTYVVKSVSTYREKIDFKYGFESLNLENEENVYISKNGERIGIENLAANDIITVYKAKKTNNENVYVIYASTESVTDILKEDGTDDYAKCFYRLDNEIYQLSDNYVYFLEHDTTQEKPSIGGEYTFLLSYDGKIAAVAEQNGSYQYGFLMRSISLDEEEQYAVEIFTLDGSAERMTFAKKVKFFSAEEKKGKKIEDKDVYQKLGTGDGLIYDMIAYKKNASDLISEIVLPLDCTKEALGTTDYPLTKDFTNLLGYADGKPRYNSVRSYYNVLDSRYNVGGVTTVVYPVDKNNRTDEKLYQKKGFSYQDEYFSTSQITLYNTDKFYNPGIITLGMNVSTEIDAESTPYMITKVSKGLDEDDMPVTVVTYNTGASEVTKNLSSECVISNDKYHWEGTPDDPQKIHAGDIVQLETDVAGNINCIRFLYKADKPSDYGYQDPRTADSSTITMASVSAIKVIHGTVVDYNSGCVLVNIKKPGERAETWPILSGNTVYGRVTYTLLEQKSGKVTSISRDEIEAGDEIIIRKRYNHGVNFFIIR
mgnify:CR=1 FL=1